MRALRSLRDAAQGDPRATMLMHKYMTYTWMLLAIPVVLTDLKKSIELLVFVSIYANVVGHWSSYQASRVEVRQDEE